MDEPDNIYLRAIRELREDNAGIRQDIKHLSLRVATLETGSSQLQSQYATIIEILSDMKSSLNEVRRRLELTGAPA